MMRRSLLVGAATGCLGLPACRPVAEAQRDFFSRGDSSVSRGTYSVDFTSSPIEDPLSSCGIWTNNTQASGGNDAPGNLTSMRVDLASDGVTHIAIATHAGVHYDDSFAFIPGFGANQFIEGVIYKAPGYNPNARGSNHELELLLGCSSRNGSRIWNECLFNAGGGVAIVYLNGGPADFKLIGDISGKNHLLPKHGDVVRAEKIGTVISLYFNGILMIRYSGADPSMVAGGSGIGVGGFIRPGAIHNMYGFMSVRMGTID